MGSGGHPASILLLGFVWGPVLRRGQTPESLAARLLRPQVSAALSVPVHPRHEQLQAQRASVEAQEMALLAERERLMQDGHRQRGLEEELRRLQSEHDRYQPWHGPRCSPARSLCSCLRSGLVVS